MPGLLASECRRHAAMRQLLGEPARRRRAAGHVGRARTGCPDPQVEDTLATCPVGRRGRLRGARGGMVHTAAGGGGAVHIRSVVGHKLIADRRRLAHVPARPRPQRRGGRQQSDAGRRLEMALRGGRAHLRIPRSGRWDCLRGDQGRIDRRAERRDGG